MSLSFRGALCCLHVLAVVAIDNGIGLTPPRGWRSWNAFDCLESKSILTQAHMEAQMTAVLDKSRMVDGRHTSLAELGFDWISMDDGWQQCNCSVRQDLDPSLPPCDGNLCFGGHCSWHDDRGAPVVRKDRFSDMKGLVDFGHARGLKVGTYLNNCICNEHGPTHYAEDVRWMVEQMGFDGVKIDSCGSSQNVSHWAELFNQTGKAIRIENCHNSWPDFDTGFCPMNFFRTGGDIGPNMNSILEEAYATVDAADLPEPRSRPGCWAYPDMSEVGNFQEGPHRADQERTHWALWCIMSSPLILGFDMNDTSKMDRVWEIITNTDALAVSAAWVGHPGTLIRAYPSQHDKTQAVLGKCDGSAHTRGWHLNQGQLMAPTSGAEALCLRSESMPCPPPTTYFNESGCGLALGNCSELPPGSHWNAVQDTIRWWDGHKTTKESKCLYANAADFNTSAGYFTRKASTVGLTACPTTLRGNAAKGPDSEKAEQRFKTLVEETRLRAAARKPLTTRADSTLSFRWTAQGELQTDSGCLRAEPVSGIQLWAKPLKPSAVAVLLINPSEQRQSLDWPIRDVPVRFTGARQAEMNFECQPGSCWARDIWNKSSFPVTSVTMPISLDPWASSFFIVSSEKSTLKHKQHEREDVFSV